MFDKKSGIYTRVRDAASKEADEKVHVQKLCPTAAAGCSCQLEPL